eukprot:6429367-Heterocapsa_arctica.AAC.1
MFVNGPLDRVGSKHMNNDKRFERNITAMAKGLPNGPVPPNIVIFDFDVDFYFDFDRSSNSSSSSSSSSSSR